MGPGFYQAGEDVDVVIETMRGHSLGRWSMMDQLNLIQVSLKCRVIHHERYSSPPKAGLFTAKRHIGILACWVSLC